MYEIKTDIESVNINKSTTCLLNYSAINVHIDTDMV